MRIAVIGAGIVGGAIAFNLARRGADVALVDAGEPGMGATSHSFAWINGFGEGAATLQRPQSPLAGYLGQIRASAGRGHRAALGRATYVDGQRRGCGRAARQRRPSAILGATSRG